MTVFVSASPVATFASACVSGTASDSIDLGCQ